MKLALIGAQIHSINLSHLEQAAVFIIIDYQHSVSYAYHLVEPNSEPGEQADGLH